MAEKKEGGTKRDPKTGRLLPGHTPPKSPGRPKKNMVSRSATNKAIDMIEQLVGKAHAVIDTALTQAGEVILTDADGNPLETAKSTPDKPVYQTMTLGGDPQTARWLIDKITPDTDTMLPVELKGDMSTMEGVINTGQTVVEWVAARKLSIDHGERMLRLLLTYAQMRAFDHMDELRKLIADFEAKTGQDQLGAMDEKLVPQWGKLLDANTKTANGTPAE